MNEEQISYLVITEAIKIHKTIGPGLLEKVYQECLFFEISKKGLRVEKEVPVPVVYEQVSLSCGYRADLVIENKFIVEVKSIEAIADIHIAQAITYLKFANCKLGLIINFNVSLLKHGIKRVALNYSTT